ncbi:MAG: aminotransferase class I/II-fold pyridoxal phosphate-dependent enzyme [Phenylobacterium sp.]|uniref:MocR-like pyridoxine biosynthesis transcription factor PdxR n=1 Tax=Phenylobacterium sp. TaxID=1871053 RepID=UPI0025DB27B4|nr:PLP-dependent aminotransferase family protein [Phenylobacterium sp.]MBI1197816.1 aminotransferase class I/II-fold pyridoxal phosphate-dependent enzyme [Phenylobacterium sp.]
MSWADIYPWRSPEPDGPVIRQVYDQVRGAIHQGALKPGGRLPSSRDLATRLGVARASVVAAYDQLLAEGYAEGRHGSGTYVSADLSGVIDLAQAPAAPVAAAPDPPMTRALEAVMGLPPLSPHAQTFSNGRTLMDARAQDAWGKSTRRALRALSPVDFGYSDPAGDPRLRAAVADYLRAARGVVCEPGQVIITTGAQHAVDLAARLLLKPGDAVWLEDPGYAPTWHALEQAGARTVGVPVDRQGLVVSAGVAAAPEARAAFVTPSHQYPLGVALSMARRLELIAWAREAGAWIVEDDYASEFRYAGQPLASLQGLDGGERVIYVGTLNKALFPGLRLGYMVAPRALAEPLAAIRRMTDRQPPTPTQAIVLDFMESGQFAAHIRRRRLAYKAQRDALVAALDRRLGHMLEPDAPDQGMHLIAYLKDGRCDLEAEASAQALGVIARAISPLHHRAPAHPGLLLGFTGFPVAAMDPGVARLAAALGA